MKKNYRTTLFTLFICFISFTSSAFTIVVSITNSCPGAETGAVTANPVGGTAPYGYSLDGITWTSSNVLPGLAPGNYTIYAVDALSANASTNFTIDETAPPLDGIVSTSPTSCFGGTGGTISVLPTNGTGPYFISIYGGLAMGDTSTASPAVFHNLIAETYSILIQDSYGCYGTLNTIVLNGDSITATATVYPPSCTGADDGYMTLSFSGGISPWTLYNQSVGWGTYSGIQGEGFGIANSGTYIFDIIDPNACVGKFTVTIPVGLPAVTHACNDTAICFAGSAQLSGYGNGTLQNIVYQWLPTTGLSNPAIADPIAAPAQTTTYTLYTESWWNTPFCISADQVTLVVINLATPVILVGDPMLTVSYPQSSVTYTWQKLIGSVWVDVGAGTSYAVTSYAQYRVRATGGEREKISTSVTTGRIITSNPAGIFSSEPAGISTFPNPASDVLKFDRLKLSEGWQTLEIINSKGQKSLPAVDIKNQTVVTINISKLTSGIYIARLTTANGKTTSTRFIKQ